MHHGANRADRSFRYVWRQDCPSLRKSRALLWFRILWRHASSGGFRTFRRARRALHVRARLLAMSIDELGHRGDNRLRLFWKSQVASSVIVFRVEPLQRRSLIFEFGLGRHCFSWILRSSCNRVMLVSVI